MERQAPRPGRSLLRLRLGTLAQNATALMISSMGTAGLGIVFWAVATRLAKPTFVGRASAEIATISLLATVAQLGLGQTFERFLPVAGERSRALVLQGYRLCAVVGLVVAVVYVALGFTHHFLSSAFPERLFFILAVVAWTIFVLQDTVLISLRAFRLVPVENILFSLMKLALLPILIPVNRSQGIIWAWMSPVLLAVLAINWYIFRRRIPEHVARRRVSSGLPPVREIVGLALGQYVTVILNIFSTSIIVLIIIVRLGAAASAYYYLPAIIAGALGQLMWNIVTSFLVEASTDPAALREHMNATIRVMLTVLVPGIGVGEVLAHWILSIFGGSYADHGTTLLRFLLLALLGTAVTEFYSSLAWLDRRVWWLMVRELVSLVIYLGVLFILIGHFGILAAGIAAVASSGLQALFFLPILVRRFRIVMSDPDGTGRSGTPSV